MGENTGIEWCDHTFNPWTGCTKISPACDHCYAADWAGRFGHVEWGAHGERRRTKTWGSPIKWNKQAEKDGTRPRVFCASLADVFDNHASIDREWRKSLWSLIEATPNLDWLLLTKRPQNIMRFVPNGWEEHFPWNVWVGATVEDQKTAEQRVPHLLKVPASVRFLSCEPLIGPVRLDQISREGESRTYYDNCLDGFVSNGFGGCTEFNGKENPRINWVITGGESGPNYRPANPDWFRSLRDQCAAADTPFLFKQWEGKSQPEIKKLGRELDGVIHDGYPSS